VKYVDRAVVFENRGRQIKICYEVLTMIERHLQRSKIDCEAGGVLLVRENVSNNNLILEFATEPMPGDKRSRNRFYRKDKGHVDFYKVIYECNQGVYAYVGEWHTHPEAVPSYSILDFNNWKKIGKESGNNSRQIHLIAGYDALRLWEFSYFEKNVMELVTIFWDEVVFNEKV